MAFVKRSRPGTHGIYMPPLSRYAGMVIRSDDTESNFKHIQRRIYALDCLLDNLPSHNFYSCSCHPDFDNWMPYFWRGYKLTTSYCYIVPPVGVEEAWKEVESTTRNLVRKGEKNSGGVIETLDPERLYALEVQSYQRQGIVPAHTKAQFQLLVKLIREHQCGVALIALDREGSDAACCVLLTDGRAVYNLINGSATQARSMGINSYLMWKAIELALNRNLAFNFLGSVNQHIEMFMRGFGGRLTPYYDITKDSRMPHLRALASADALARRVAKKVLRRSR